MQADWTYAAHGNVHVHVQATDKYKTTSVMAVIEIPLTRASVTEFALLPAVLMRGTRQHPSPEGIVRAFDALYGASFTARSGKHADIQTLEFSMHVPSEEFLPGAQGLFAAAMSLFADVLFDPFVVGDGFAEQAVAIEKTLHKQKIENVVNDKMTYAAERCTQLMCDDEPYGIPRLGYASDLSEITPRSLLQTYRAHVSPAPVHVYIVGNFDAKKAADTVFAAFGARRSYRSGQGDAGIATVKHGGQAPESPKLVIEEMDVNQGKLNMGLRSSSDYAADDYPALLVYNGVLGGFPHSKLFLNVREKASLAYYASSRLEGLKGFVFIYSGIQVQDFDQARNIVEEQLASLRTGDVSEEEMENTKQGLINQYLQSDDQPLTGAVMQMYARYSGRSRSVDELIEAVRAVTVQDVMRIAADVVIDTVYFLRDKEVTTHA